MSKKSDKADIEKVSQELVAATERLEATLEKELHLEAIAVRFLILYLSLFYFLHNFWKKIKTNF